MTGIVMATMLEARPFVQGLGLELIQEGPFPVYRGEDTVLVISNIGKVNAAMATVYIACGHKLTRVFNMGAAGCTRTGFSIGDIFQINRVLEHDRPHLLSKKERILAPSVIDGFRCATLATGDVAVTEPAKRHELSSVADLIDMEGAAVVQACKRFDLQIYLFKIVTDTPEHEKDADIIRNVKMTSGALFAFYAGKIKPQLR